MSRAVYFDCFSGCSGDMVLGAFLDAGLKLEDLKSGLGLLGLAGYQLSVEKVKRAAITASRFQVKVDNVQPQPDRSLTAILGLISSSSLPHKVKERSAAAFRRLGEVEAQIHGIEIEKVHFHEIGAVDSIVDIVGSLLALEILKIERLFCSPLPLGKGVITTEHGALPVPAPATLKLLALAKAPIQENSSEFAPRGELVTPTGATLVSQWSEFRRPSMTLEQVGHGAGSKDFPNWPNVLRVWIGSEAESPENQDLVQLETNIDDMSPQIYGYLMETLFAAKALDVWFTPIQMKKNRPAVMLSVLAPVAAEAGIVDIIFRETSTLGLRVRPVARHTLSREITDFQSSLGPVKVKVKRLLSGEASGYAPEYEDCRHIAQKEDLPLQEVFRILQAEIHSKLGISAPK